MKTILVPIDFSPASDAVIDEAIALAQPIGARVVIQHVVQPPPLVATNFGMVDGSDPLATDEDERAAGRLRQLQRELQAEGITVHAIHQRGHPGTQIVEQAERLGAEFIVLGSHGHTAIYDLVVGSTTSFVLKRTSCAVVLVPPTRATIRPRRRSSDKPALPVHVTRAADAHHPRAAHARSSPATH